MNGNPVSLFQLNRILAQLITSSPATQNIWVTAELSDVSQKGGHCYMELIEKDDGGKAIAKARAVIWQSVACMLLPKFERITGQRFCSGIKVMVRASATMHPLYGMSLVISEINPEFTMGDLVRKRMEILRRLKENNILDENKKLEWKEPALNIAVISAKTAAGFGDFFHQIRTSGVRFRFNISLFEAVMQGDRTVGSILDALVRIEREIDKWDGVVIIRGGGATSDFAAFENYELAERIACFELPVIVGIGHERDVTVLDYVANLRVKTPTAAADWLIEKANRSYSALENYSKLIHQAATEKINGQRMYLNYAATTLPLVIKNSLSRERNRVERFISSLDLIRGNRLPAAIAYLDSCGERLSLLVRNIIMNARKALDNKESINKVLSPQATLKRGYTITKIDGKTLTSAKTEIEKGEILTVCFHDGEINTQKI